MAKKTNQRKFINLVGFESKNLNDSKLPVNRDVLSLFFYKHRTENLTILDSAKFVLCEIIKVWDKYLLPTKNSHHSLEKIRELYKNWQKTQVHKARKKSSAQQILEKNFSNSLNQLFDIAPQNALQMLKSPQKRLLIDSREISKGSQLLHIARNVQEIQSTSSRWLESDFIVEVEREIGSATTNSDINGKDLAGILKSYSLFPSP